MLDTVVDEVEELLGTELCRRKSIVVGNSFGKMSLFLYSRNSRTPIVVCKIPGNKEGEIQCSREYDSLRHFSIIRVPGMAAPLPIGSLDVKGRLCFIQSVVNSNLLYHLLKPAAFFFQRSHFSWVTDKLIDLYRATLSEVDESGVAEQTCFVHGDFWVGNLGTSGEELVLYDFEYAQSHGSPLTDLLHFILYYSVALGNAGKVARGVASGQYQRTNEERVFELGWPTVFAALLGQGNLSMMFRKLVVRYLCGCGLSIDDGIELTERYLFQDRMLGPPSELYWLDCFGSELNAIWPKNNL